MHSEAHLSSGCHARHAARAATAVDTIPMTAPGSSDSGDRSSPGLTTTGSSKTSHSCTAAETSHCRHVVADYNLPLQASFGIAGIALGCCSSKHYYW